MSQVPPMKGPHMLLVSFLITEAEGYHDAPASHCHTDCEGPLFPLTGEDAEPRTLWRAAALPPQASFWFSTGEPPFPSLGECWPGQTRHSVSSDTVVSSSGVSWLTPGQPKPLSIFRKFAKCLRK